MDFDLLESIGTEANYLESTNRFTNQYRRAKVIQAFRIAFMTEIYTAAKTISDLKNERSVWTSIGMQLDRIGEITDIERPLVYGVPMEDNRYRQLILGQIGVHTSNGDFPSLLRAFSLLVSNEEGENSSTNIFIVGKGGLIFEFRGTLEPNLRHLVSQRLQQMLKAGSRVASFVLLPESEEETFRFSSATQNFGPGFGGQFSEEILDD